MPRYLGYLDDLIGLASLIVSGTALPRRSTTELVAGTGITLSAADDLANNRSIVTLSTNSGAAISNVVITFGSTTLNTGTTLVGTGTLAGLTTSDVIVAIPPIGWTAGNVQFSTEIAAPGNGIKISVYNPGANTTLSALTQTFKVARFVG